MSWLVIQKRKRLLQNIKNNFNNDFGQEEMHENAEYESTGESIDTSITNKGGLYLLTTSIPSCDVVLDVTHPSFLNQNTDNSYSWGRNELGMVWVLAEMDLSQAFPSVPSGLPNGTIQSY